MATEEDSHEAEILDGISQVVDMDSHTTESMEQVLPYVDPKYEGLLELIEGSQVPLIEVFSVKIPSNHPRTTDGENPYFTEEQGPDHKLEQLDQAGIDTAILHPTLFNTITDVHNDRFAVALANAYNSWREEVFHEASDRLKSTILIAPQQPQRAAEEIHARADQDGFVGVELPGSLVPPAGHEMYEPIYQAASDHDLPISIHTGLNEVFRTQFEWNHNWTEDNSLNHPFTQMWDLTTLAARGVMERFPDLEFVFSEAGVSWVPYLMGRLDDHHQKSLDDLPIDSPPSEYIREQCYFTTHPLGPDTGDYLGAAIEQIGIDSVCFGANIPAADHDTPETVVDRLPLSSRDAYEKVLNDNAASIFGL